MGTIVEGNWDNVFGLIRKGGKWRMDRKVKVVEGLLAKGR